MMNCKPLGVGVNLYVNCNFELIDLMQTPLLSKYSWNGYLLSSLHTFTSNISKIDIQTKSGYLTSDDHLSQHGPWIFMVRGKIRLLLALKIIGSNHPLATLTPML